MYKCFGVRHQLWRGRKPAPSSYGCRPGCDSHYPCSTHGNSGTRESAGYGDVGSSHGRETDRGSPHQGGYGCANGGQRGRQRFHAQSAVGMEHGRRA